MTTAASADCWHCGEPMPADGGTSALIAGVDRPMCCGGCRAAALWIEQLGLGDYYRLRDASTARAGSGAGPQAAARAGADRQPFGPVAADDAAWSDEALLRHVVRPAGGQHLEVMLLVDGMRCAACVWLIERALGTVAGVVTVQVNATARRARIVFDPRHVSLPRLLETVARAGYRPLPLDGSALDDARRRESRDALKRLLVAGFGAMQSMMYASALYFGAVDTMDEATRSFFRWIGFLVATPVVLYSGRPFFAGALRSLRAQRMGMDVPVAIAVAAIYGASLVVALRGGAEVYFESVTMFVFFLLCGRYVEMRARHRAGDLSDAVARLMPAFADRRLDDGSLARVAIADLVAGMRIRVADGDAVPADGRLESDACLVDESLLTGESTPVARARGDVMVAGSLVTEGPAELVVTRTGSQTTLAAIVALVTRAQVSRPRLAQAGDRAAGLFVARILVLTALTAALWLYFDPSRAFDAAIAVLVVSCPCAFALAVPAAITRCLAVLARRGVLVVQPDAIETLAGVSHFVFDKTGTLTDRRLTLERVQVLSAELDPKQALQLAATLARESRHPASLAIAAAAAGRDAAAFNAAGSAVTSAATAVSAVPGAGVEATVDGRRLRLGRVDFSLRGAPVPAGREGDVLLADDRGPLAAFTLGEQLRSGARSAVADLSAQGLRVEIASGDAPARVAAVAEEAGVGQWRARQLPEDKLQRLADLRAGGAQVAVVGDGINDAPILAGADVAVALASGADLAQASSDIVLTSESLESLPLAVRLARDTLSILRQNQRWALAYNLSAVPLAAFGLVPPWLAALGMSLSSLLVVLNAMRIGGSARRPRLTRPSLVMRSTAAYGSGRG